MPLLNPLDNLKSASQDLESVNRATSANPSTHRAERRIVWEWNLPLLTISAVVVVIVSVLLVGLYFWQSQRLADGILQRASTAEQAGDLTEQARWLSRYVGLVPDDVDSHIKLALTVDAMVATPSDLEQARRRLNAALIACGESPGYQQQKEMLRRKLIERLLQFGRLWASEAAKQVLLLDAEAGEPQATKWLAQALVAKQGDANYEKPAASQFDREQEYWEWLASQPLGAVLSVALEANPDDVDLAASFLEARQQHRDWFDAVDQPADSQAIDEQATQLIDRLRKQTDNGRAQLIAYAYLIENNPPEARGVIEQAVEPALARLASHAEVVGDAGDSSDKKEEQAKDASASLASLAGDSLLLSPTAYQPYWDWQLAAEAARVFATNNDQRRAKDIYVRLLALDSDAVPQQQREATFVTYGSFLAEMEDISAAIDLWKLGAERIPESLELTRMLASAYTSQRDTEQAQAYVSQYKAIVESQRARLDGVYGAQLTTLAKQAIRQRLDTAGWEVLLLQSRLAIAQNDLVAACDLSRQAFTSPLILSNDQRLQAGRLLADCYAQRELWDMAGQTFDRCISLAPSDATLRRGAALAWRKAGSADPANLPLENLDDGSFEAAVQIARLTALNEAAKAPEQADVTAVAKATQLARDRYEQASPEAQASMNVWQLELLEMNSMTAETGSADLAQRRLDRLEQIAESYPNVSELQMLAAVSLASSGRESASQQAIDRLQALADASGQSQDLANLALTQASLRSARDDMPGAIELIRTAMRDLPDQQLRLAKAGANAALHARQPKLVYDLLHEVPESQLDTQALFTLSLVALALQASGNTQVSNLDQELKAWGDKLRTIEGEQGTHWRYLKAQQLLSSSSRRGVDRQDQLNQATRLFNEIDARRPHWGLAAALGGQIAYQKGLPDESMTLLRRAIRDGDRQVATIWSLVQQLKAAGRFDEAGQELQRMGSDSATLLPMSAMQVDLAQLQGDFDAAVAKARELVQEKSQEYASWLLLADAMLKSANRAGVTPEEKQAKLQEGWQALEKAKELSQGKDIHVWDARFRFQLASGDQQAAEQELIELQKSSIDNEPRLLAAGRGYLQLNDFSKARELFDACLAINAKSSATYLALVELHNRMGDPASSLDALRHAQAADPDNQDLRERLAVSLAFGAGGAESSSEQNTAEIARLLANTGADSSPRTRLVKALIDLSKGSPQQQRQALTALRDVARASTGEGLDAERMLANYYASQWLAKPSDSDSKEGRRNFDEAVSFYASLTNLSAPNALDVARYADFMLKAFALERDAGRKGLADARLIDAQRAVRKLQGISGSSIASLQLIIRLAIAQGKQNEIESLTSNWVQGAGDLGELEQQQVWEFAGQILADLGMVKDSIVWLERVYQQDSSKYQRLVVALAQVQQIDRSLQLCVAGYQRKPSVEAATLLAEVAILLGQQPASAEVEQAFRDALVKFSNSPQFLEAFATVRLMQERFEEAATWFEAVEKLAPGRVRTLNNLAMALSVLPMGGELALKKIEKAIEIQGRLPELLDTHGLVLFRNGKLDQARKVLIEAAEHSDDPRFQLHLAQVAFAQDDSSAAQLAWQQIDHAKLKDVVLTTDEQAVLARLEKQNQQVSQ